METLETLRHLFDEVLAVNSEPEALPGLSRQAIEQVFADLKLTPPEILVCLYEWHNGIEYLDAFMSFLPLERAVSIYRGYQALTDRIGRWGWKSSQFPILDENGDIQLCIDCSSGELVSVCLENDDKTRQVAAHYEPYVEAMAELFRQKAYVFDEAGGCIHADAIAWRGIAQAYGIKKSWLAT
ncbi:SMI1/KNR4 family protein [Dyella silvatica]|uniref:SMI1/KNR4 family protein n=1 Tax=Dyella silvatica TaxID=2992128 RepID=UPI0022558C28|nr:SMI1/KNR4 family protein [Dyella silvatica]